MQDIRLENSLTFSLKFSIFAVFDDLLTSNSMEIKEFFIVHTIEFLQMIYFCFNSVFKSTWKSTETYDIIESILKYSWVIPLFKEDYYFYRVVYYIITLIMITIIIGIIYQMLSLRKNVSSSTLFKKTLVFFSDIFMQILFIPFIHSFSIIFHCKGSGMNLMYPNNLTCFQSEHIIMVILSSIGLILTVSYAFLLTLFYCETLPKNNNIKARFFANYDKVFLISKIIIYYMLEFSDYFLDSDQALWICSCTLLLLNFLNFLYLYNENSYLNKNIMKILLCYRSIEFYTSVVIVVNIIIRDSKKFNGDFLLILLGGLLLILMFLIYRYSNYNVLIKNENIIKDESDLIQKFSYLSYLLKSTSNIENLQMLKGYILSQNDKNSNNIYLSVLKQYYENQDENNLNSTTSTNEKSNEELSIKDASNMQVTGIFEQENNKNGYDKNKLVDNQDDKYNDQIVNGKILDLKNLLKRSEKEEKNYLLKYIEECYRKALEKHPHSNILKIHYLQYIIFFMKNYEQASILLKRIYETSPLIEQQFILYRFNKKLEEEILLKSMKSVVKVEISTILLNKKNIDFCKYKIKNII